MHLSRRTSIDIMQKILLLLTLFWHQGYGKPSISGKIVGGEDAMIGDWPWQVSLHLDGEHLCGGSLISDSWVLTSGHCFKYTMTLSRYTIYLGLDKQSDLQNPETVVRELSQAIVHPDFTEEGDIGDIALAELKKPVTFSPSVHPVCLTTESLAVSEGTLCWIMGWGYIQDGVPLPTSKSLQVTKLPVIDNNNCEALYRSTKSFGKKYKLIKTDMFCAGYKEGERDACQGDSGGALVCSVNDVWVQIGISSWGWGCAEPRRPGVYTKVQYYLPWIKENIKSLNKNEGAKTPYSLENCMSSGVYQKKHIKSGCQTHNDAEHKTQRLVGNRAHSHLWSMTNAILIVLGLVLLL